MEQQPTKNPSNKEINDIEEEMESVSLQSGPNDPNPNPKPDPVTNAPAADDNNNIINTRVGEDVIDLNEKKVSETEEEKEEKVNNSSSGNIESEDIGELKSRKSVTWSEELVMKSPISATGRNFDDRDDRTGGSSSNPYVNCSPADASSNSSAFNFKDTMSSVKDVLGQWGKKVGEATRKAEDLAGNTWQHLKTSPSLTDAALGRIAQGTKVLAEGGYEKIFRQTFETAPEEELKNSFACYLSTSAGPVMGVLYVSTAKLAFCSDNPLSYQAGDTTEWSYYKVVIPLHQLKAVNPSTSRTNAAEKYIQVISIDNHEFWYMGFLNYGGAVESLQEALQARDIQSA